MIRCPHCGDAIETRYGRVPHIHLRFVDYEEHTLEAKTHKTRYYHCPGCGKNFVKTTAFVEVDLERMKGVKAYV